MSDSPTRVLVWEDSGGEMVVSAEDYKRLEEQLESLRQALRETWDDYANAIDEHTSDEVRKEARHSMLRRFSAFQDEGWLDSSPATVIHDSVDATARTVKGDGPKSGVATSADHIPAKERP